MLVAILLIAAFLSACVSAESPPADNGTPPSSGGDSAGGDNAGDVPEPYYSRVTENGREYVYFGHAADEAADADLNNALVNLKASGTLTADSEGFYVYDDKKYVCLTASEAAAGRKLGDGAVIESGKEYFFEYAPVKWRVLSVTEDVALLLSEKVLGAAVYNPAGSFDSNSGQLSNGEKANDIEYSFIKTYLNGELKEALFTEYESSYLAGAITLLTSGQIDQYDLSEEDGYMMTVSPTEYLVASGVDVSKTSGGEQYYSSWWLASEGRSATSAALVSVWGQYGDSYEDTVSATHGVRPVIALRL